MSQEKVQLASENWAPAHPRILQAVMEANDGAAASYGADRWTTETQRLIQEAFHRVCKVFFVPTGTGANVLALKLSCRSHESVICTDISHIQYQESGAAEAVVGCKLLTVKHEGGKITREGLLKALRRERAFGKHSTSPRVLSIAQPTEIGTVYSVEELQALSKICKEEGLLMHVDGSRLYNALVALKMSPEEMVKAAGIDILSLGGTKNGLMGAEALVIFNTALQEGSDHLQKQTLQLLSKMRYLSAQYLPFFEDGGSLWKELATRANSSAREIAAIIAATPQLALSCPVDTNQIFFTAPAAWIPLLQEKIACYLWDKDSNEMRFIASWNTSAEDVERVRAVIHEIGKAGADAR